MNSPTSLREEADGYITVYALYSRNHYLLFFLGFLFIAEISSLCYILVVVTPRLAYNDECYVTSSPSIFQYYWSVHRLLLYILYIADCPVRLG